MIAKTQSMQQNKILRIQNYSGLNMVGDFDRPVLTKIVVLKPNVGKNAALPQALRLTKGPEHQNEGRRWSSKNKISRDEKGNRQWNHGASHKGRDKVTFLERRC